MATPALIYCRISRDREGGGLGVERQERECRALAGRLGLDVVDVLTDNDLSAYSGKPRPGYRALCEAIEHGRARTVLVWHTDRLHRSPAELEQWITLADPRGVVVQTVQAGKLDLATPSGRVSARVLGAVARGESEHRSARIKSQKNDARERQKWLGGRRPFGYGPDGVTLRSTDATGKIIDESEAGLILSGTERILSGGSLRSVVRAWNAAGSVTSTGRPWGHKGVRDVLRRWRNAGQHEHDDVPAGPAEWPGIVTADQVHAVRAVLDGNETEHAQANQWGNRARWLLSGIALCPCGEPLRAVTSRTRPRVYRCTAYGPGHVTRLAEPIDALVGDVMTRRLARGDVAELVTAAAGPTVDVAGLRATRAAAERRLGEVAGMLGDGDLDPEQAREASRRARARRDGATAELARLERTSPAARVASVPDPVAWWNDPDTDLDDRRELIRALLVITVHRQGPGRRAFDPETVEIVSAMPGTVV